jgi:transposase
METQEITVEKLLKIIEEKDRTIAELKQQVQWFMEQIRLAKHRQFGISSEQTNVHQMNLFNEAEAAADLTAPEPSLSEVKAHYRKKRTRLTTDKLPEDLPVEIIEHELPESERICSDCGSEMHTMGREIREELKIIPAKAVIVRHVRHVYSCRNCEETSDRVPVVKADMPEPVIKGSFASPETIAHIATQKFMMASPLYRQEQEWKQNGILLSRQTMSNWLIKACEEWLEPIYEKMKQRLCSHDVLHGDETVLQVLKEPGKAAQSKSYMWLFRTSGEAKHQIILYDYQPDRKHTHPEDLFVERTVRCRIINCMLQYGKLYITLHFSFISSVVFIPEWNALIFKSRYLALMFFLIDCTMLSLDSPRTPSPQAAPIRTVLTARKDPHSRASLSASINIALLFSDIYFVIFSAS